MWQRAIAQSNLSRRDKGFCLAVLVSADFRTGETRVSMATLGNRAGYSVRALQKTARQLEARGILVYPYGRKGGIAESGRGLTPVMRLMMRPLLEHKGALSAPLKGAFHDVQGRIPEQPRAHSATGKGAASAPKETTAEQNNEKNIINPKGADGGGGGGACAGFGEDPSTDQEPSFELLTKFGVSAGVARTLAHRLHPGIIDAGLEWMNENGTYANNPSGLLVSILNNGTAEAKWKRQTFEEQRVQGLALTARRVAALKVGVTIVRENWKWAKTSPLDERLAEIQHAFPSLTDVANEQILSDDELFGESSVEQWMSYYKSIHERARLRNGTSIGS